MVSCLTQIHPARSAYVARAAYTAFAATEIPGRRMIDAATVPQRLPMY